MSYKGEQVLDMDEGISTHGGGAWTAHVHVPASTNPGVLHSNNTKSRPSASAAAVEADDVDALAHMCAVMPTCDIAEARYLLRITGSVDRAVDLFLESRHPDGDKLHAGQTGDSDAVGTVKVGPVACPNETSSVDAGVDIQLRSTDATKTTAVGPDGRGPHGGKGTARGNLGEAGSPVHASHVHIDDLLIQAPVFGPHAGHGAPTDGTTRVLPLCNGRVRYGEPSGPDAKDAPDVRAGVGAVPHYVPLNTMLSANRGHEPPMDNMVVERGYAADGMAAVQRDDDGDGVSARGDTNGQDNHPESSEDFYSMEEESASTCSISSISSNSFGGDVSDLDDLPDHTDSWHDEIVSMASAANHEIMQYGLMIDTRARSLETQAMVHIHTVDLPPCVALAWGVDRTSSIQCGISIEYPTVTEVMSVRHIKVHSVAQPDTGKDFSVGPQLLQIMKNFCAADERETPTAYQSWIKRRTDHAKSKNLLVRLVSYTHFRLQSLHMYCAICGAPHDPASFMVMPSVCTRRLCMFSWRSFAQLRMGRPIENPRLSMTQLLRTFFVVAAASHRRMDVLNPWPEVVTADGHAINVDPAVVETIALRQMDEIPTLPCSSCKDWAGMNPEASAVDDACALCGIETWIMSSNRSTLVHIDFKHQHPDLKTTRQFHMISNPPELEAKFQMHKKDFGSRFFFHGSPTENWHSIMRNGFFVSTGKFKHLRLHGAAYGEGVYVASNLSTAMAYTHAERLQTGNSKGLQFQFKRRPAQPTLLTDPHWQICCVALCEVVSSPLVKDHGVCLVVPDAELIVPRFLFVWDSSSGYCNYRRCLRSDEPDFERWCRHHVSDENDVDNVHIDVASAIPGSAAL
eukprot:m.91337 g.91337  ORF g.91337 m.91337 type:complete len:855 (+) comp9898_c0_seq1:302-2866(+)